MLSRARADAESARSRTQKRSFHGIWCEIDVEFGDDYKKLIEMQNYAQLESNKIIKIFFTINLIIIKF